MIDAKCPYKYKDDVPVGENDCIVLSSATEVAIANSSFAAGRASRDGLRKAMIGVLEAPDDHSKGPAEYDFAWAEFHKALTADEEEK